MKKKTNKKTLSVLIISIIVLAILVAAAIWLFNPHKNNANVANINKPTILSISPISVLAGATSAIDLRVYGHNLKADSIINWNGSPMKTDATFVSNGFLKAVIPVSSLAAAGKYNITITNPLPDGGTSDPAQFQVIPTIQ